MVVDSSVWLSYLKGHPAARAWKGYLEAPELLIPTIVVYEVCKVLRRDSSQAAADAAVTRLRLSRQIPVDEAIAIRAAAVSLEHGLSMADAIIYATAQAHDALLVTTDAHFMGLPNVRYLALDAQASEPSQ